MPQNPATLVSDGNIQIPQEKMSKVVQLYIDGSPVLRSGNPNLFHGDILKSALDELGIDYKEIVLCEGSAVSPRRKGPEREGEHYRLAGAGLCSKRGSLLYFGSDSLDYNVGINREHMEQCRSFLEGNGFTVEFK